MRPKKNIFRIGFGLKAYLCCLALSLFSYSFISFAKAPNLASRQIEAGKRIYMEGILPNGQPLQGDRVNTVTIEGVDAACENCHRRSGMGSLEGNIVTPPITGRFLFSSQEDRPRVLLNPQAPKNINKPRAPYDTKAFARAIRQGIGVNGRELNSLMPRYKLSDNNLAALKAYLNQLSANLPNGVGDDSLYFATIVAPGVDQAKREVMIKMIKTAFQQRNASQEEYSGRMRMPIDLIPRTQRNWVLDVWALDGTPDTWPKQLSGFYKKEPVFAVISGLGDNIWNPVHDFCQTQKLPCLLPSIVMPPEKNDFYSLYYSRGLAMEADVLAKQLRSLGKTSVNRLIQVYRSGTAGELAAQKLSEDLKASEIHVETRSFSSDPVTMPDDNKAVVVMLWLRPDDLALFSQSVANLSTTTYLSGYLLDEKFSIIPKSWQGNVKVIYPYELGKNRQKSDGALKAWLTSWRLPLVDTAFQSEIFYNLLFLTDIVSQMLDNLYQDYMVEKAEDMLSTGTNYSAYPHLELSRSQRFASKGAYIARIGEDGVLVNESEWLIP